MSPIRRVALLLSMVMLAGADSAPRWQVLDRAADEALAAKDYKKLRTVLDELMREMPGNSRVTYNLAASEARLGEKVAALAGLRQVVAMGLTYDFLADEDFASLRDEPELIELRRRLEENRRPQTQARLVTTLAEGDLLPEDITYDEKTGRLFISSVRQAKIITSDGKLFATANWSVLALRIDAQRRLLWAATGWVPHCLRCAASDRDKSALLAFDLDSGALKRRIESPVKGLLADMTISRNGDLYVSEGIHGAVLRLPADGVQMVRLDRPGEFPSPQTPALSSDEKVLFVADYVRGIGALDLATQRVRFLSPKGPLALNGIDGLYRDGDGFIAVQNGTAPPRIVRLTQTLDRQRVLEANWPGLGEPTHGVLVGDTFYFLANTGWNAYDGKGQRKPGPPVISTVRALSLTAR
jgi:sugar lactone lactonase YvrE